jgi:phage gpG-like protein
MEIRVTYDDKEVQKALRVTVDALTDLAPIFKRFLAWLRPEIQKVFDQQGPGWAPLDKASKERRTKSMPELADRIRQRALNPLERSVGRTHSRAVKRFIKTSPDAKLYERRKKTLAKQEAQHAEAQRIAQEQRDAIYGPLPTGKQFAKIGQRVEKYRASAEERIAALERGDLLGRIASSIRSRIDRGSLTIESMIQWAGVHNDGGTAGNGARIPERKFLEWTPERIEKFIEIAQQYVTEKFNKS